MTTFLWSLGLMLVASALPYLVWRKRLGMLLFFFALLIASFGAGVIWASQSVTVRAERFAALVPGALLMLAASILAVGGAVLETRRQERKGD